VTQSLPYGMLADMVLIVHFSIVLFVVGGLIVIVAGGLLGWRLVRSLWFRLAHLAAIAIVAAQAWLGAICPLTTLEMWLRAKAQQTTYTGSFVEFWLQQLIYYDAPWWVFTLAYSAFALIVVAAWFYFPPGSSSKRK
jgi:hypothetical protein